MKIVNAFTILVYFIAFFIFMVRFKSTILFFLFHLMVLKNITHSRKQGLTSCNALSA